jgi:hypothetical protein
MTNIKILLDELRQLFRIQDTILIRHPCGEMQYEFNQNAHAIDNAKTLLIAEIGADNIGAFLQGMQK